AGRGRDTSLAGHHEPKADRTEELPAACGQEDEEGLTRAVAAVRVSHHCDERTAQDLHGRSCATNERLVEAYGSRRRCATTRYAGCSHTLSSELSPCRRTASRASPATASARRSSRPPARCSTPAASASTGTSSTPARPSWSAKARPCPSACWPRFAG